MDNTPINEHLILLASFIPIAIVVGIFAWKRGFFRLSSKSASNELLLSFWEVLGAFFIYFMVHFLIIPIVVMAVILFMTGSLFSFETMDAQTQGWLNITTMVASLVAVVGYLWWLPCDRRRILWGNGRTSLRRRGRDVLVGIGGLFVSYPFVMIIAHLMGVIVIVTLSPTKEEQVAVRYFKTTLEYPKLLWVTVISIVTVIPIIEELLFRGFLQTWLRRHLHQRMAIVISAFVFSAFHFSLTQSYSNIELLSSLFVLSCFLGFVYERQQSLIAPITLHMVFNAINIGIILFSSSE